MLENCNQKSAYKIGLLKGYYIMTVDPEFANDHSVIGSIRRFLCSFPCIKNI